MQLATFNKIYCKAHNLELVKDKDYFYWFGLTEEVGLKLSSLEYETGVYVCLFSHLTLAQWIDALNFIIKKIENEKATQE